MELYYVITVMDRDRTPAYQELCRELHLNIVLTKLGRGTATKSQLLFHKLRETEKAIVTAVVTGDSMRRLMRDAERKLCIDIPGNGVMMAVPMKSVSGGKSLAFLTDGQELGGSCPVMNFKYELIVVILNEGFADSVMDAARSAGATGGTILHAKGTGGRGSGRFLGVSLAEEKDMIYILATSGKKSQIMQAVNRNCGIGTKAGAVCFSLPVSEAVGIRRLDEETE